MCECVCVCVCVCACVRVCVCVCVCFHLRVNRLGLAVKREAGKQTDIGSIPLRLSSLFKSCGLRTLNETLNETLKWLTSLPIVMQESL